MGHPAAQSLKIWTWAFEGSAGGWEETACVSVNGVSHSGVWDPKPCCRQFVLDSVYMVRVCEHARYPAELCDPGHVPAM